MDKFNDENIIDTDFEEVNEELLKDRDIKREPLYYTRTQVANILNEKESTISYWSREFQPILNLKIINMTRKYTKKDVENLLFIQKLIREDNMQIKQVLEYCKAKGFSKEGLIDTSNPLAIKTFISAMTDEFDNKVAEMQNNIILQQQEMIQTLKNIIIQNNENTKQEVALTVDEIISERNEALKQEVNELIINNLNESSSVINQQLKEQKEDNQKLSKQIEDNFTNINTTIKEQNEKTVERDIQIVDNLMQRLQERKEYELEPKGLFAKIFHKKK